jgi:hypothetical protein
MSALFSIWKINSTAENSKSFPAVPVSMGMTD